MSAATTGIYRAGTIKRKRRTKEQQQKLDAQIVAVLAADHPQSVRHVFYRMTDPRLPEPVEKSDRGYRHVQNRVTQLRRSGAVPYGWVSDASRRGYFVNTFGDAADFIRRMSCAYRADLWRDSPFYVEVWAESRSIAGVIQDDCEDLAVSLYPCGGFSSITLAYEAAEHMNFVCEKHGKRAVVLYIGDYDPAGVLIDGSLETELALHMRHPLTFIRLAVNEQQIADYDLPTKPRKESDRRSLHVDVAVEAEAMPARVLRGLLREAVESYLPVRALEVAKVAEDSERSFLLSLADAIERDG